MHIIYGKSKWEMENAPLDAFLQRARADGFDATETNLHYTRESPAEVARLHQHYGLQMISQIVTLGATPEEHRHSLEAQFALLAQCPAVFINGHVGRDIFSVDDNLRLLRRALELSRERGIPFGLETHRSRPSYSAVETRKYLDALPELRLTADFSHWTVVHESDLADQSETLQLAITRSDYIHARVGHAEGPQVNDPRAPEWTRMLDAHRRWWQAIVDAHKATASPVLYITPEFGPPGYMPTLPFTNQPVADTWNINVYMKDLLQRTLVI